MTALYCQPDWVWSHLEDALLAESLKMFPERCNRGRTTCGGLSAVPRGRSPGMNRKETVESELTTQS